MLLWFAGEDPVQVSGHIHRLGTGIDETDAFQILFRSGAVAQCLVTQAASTFFFNVSIYGGAGWLTVRAWDFTRYEIEVESRAVGAYAHSTLIRRRPIGDHISTTLVPELEEFALAVSYRRAPAVTAADARRVLQTLDAVVAADRSGRAVRLG